MKPRICVSVKADRVENVSRAVRVSQGLGASLVELRMDYAREEDYPFILETVEKSRIGCVATIRPVWDGGAYRGGEGERLRLFEKALEAPFKYVDVEQGSRVEGDVSRLASRRGVGLILSHHDWRGTPGLKNLERTLAVMRRRNADVYKVVTTVRNPVDEATILIFLKNVRGARVVCFGMGEKGLATRLVSPLLGGFMTYASYGEPLAAGQTELRRMVSIYRRMGVW
ncbi:MAG: type I 3-dehydroquinate dehydratase [Thermoproteota archaeon]